MIKVISEENLLTKEPIYVIGRGLIIGTNAKEVHNIGDHIIVSNKEYIISGVGKMSTLMSRPTIKNYEYIIKPAKTM